MADKTDFAGFEKLVTEIRQANAVFLLAAGRSGFSMQALAMRLMHLGIATHYVGGTITPAIKPGDLLITASGSGTTACILRGAEQSKRAGARVFAITANANSPLASIADGYALLPAATKQDHSGVVSKQYAGSLFEQALLLVGDAVFTQLWKLDGSSAETLWTRHANIE